MCPTINNQQSSKTTDMYLGEIKMDQNRRCSSLTSKQEATCDEAIAADNFPQKHVIECSFKSIINKQENGLSKAAIINGEKTMNNGEKAIIVSIQDNDKATSSQVSLTSRQAPFMFAGILASILGSTLFSISILCVELMPEEESPQSKNHSNGLLDKTRIIWYRGVLLMLLSALATYVFSSRSATLKIHRHDLCINILRSLFAFMACYGTYISLQYISMGDSTALIFSSPIWTSLLSHYILNEPLQWIQLVALPASLFGIILIAHPALIIQMNYPSGASERQPILVPPEFYNSRQHNFMEPIFYNLTAILSEIFRHNEDNTNHDEFTKFIQNNVELSQLTQNLSLPGPQNNSFSLIELTKLIQDWNFDLDAATDTSETYDFEHRWKGIVIALLTSFLVSGQYIVFRLHTRTSIQATIFWIGTATFLTSSLVLTSLIGLDFSSIYQYLLPHDLIDWTLLLANGCFSWLGQGLLQWGLCYEDASILSVIRTLDVALTFALSAIFLREDILWTSILGSSIIALVVVVVMLNNWWSKRGPKKQR